uniref:Ferritin n=1 Tax=Samia ricini TaxID=63990 RepID=A0A5B8XCI8_SAMRI|nr:ferritin light chain subunit [Samia ricini]
MKKITFAVACLLALSSVYAGDRCYEGVTTECVSTTTTLSLGKCNAQYGEYNDYSHVAGELQAYANLYLKRSYEYLLSASYFNNYKINRAGFSKMFRKLSDEAWEKAIDLIKHVTMRGINMDFSRRSIYDPEPGKKYVVELHELDSLAKALDTQKELAERAFTIHREATKNANNLHDPEIAQYLEEKFIEDHATTIRELAGFTNDLKGVIISNDKDLSLALYIFDEYLQKVV